MIQRLDLHKFVSLPLTDSHYYTFLVDEPILTLIRPTHKTYRRTCNLEPGNQTERDTCVY